MPVKRSRHDHHRRLLAEAADVFEQALVVTPLGRAPVSTSIYSVPTPAFVAADILAARPKLVVQRSARAPDGRSRRAVTATVSCRDPLTREFVLDILSKPRRQRDSAGAVWRGVAERGLVSELLQRLPRGPPPSPRPTPSERELDVVCGCWRL
jgi:hypothetical protein